MILARALVTVFLILLAGFIFWIGTQPGMAPIQNVGSAIVGGIVTYWLSPPGREGSREQ